eukprot:6190732-Pleurochrysis_carterae.AAC.2
MHSIRQEAWPTSSLLAFSSNSLAPVDSDRLEIGVVYHLIPAAIHANAGSTRGHSGLCKNARRRRVACQRSHWQRL